MSVGGWTGLNLVTYPQIVEAVNPQLDSWAGTASIGDICRPDAAGQMLEEGNPPIGILLCTHKSHSLVKFALAGMDNRIFVSKYQMELPKPEEIERFLAEKIKEVGENDE